MNNETILRAKIRRQLLPPGSEIILIEPSIKMSSHKKQRRIGRINVVYKKPCGEICRSNFSDSITGYQYSSVTKL